jgi:hypothetical protein
VPTDSQTPISLDDRRASIAAAFRAVRTEPRVVPQPVKSETQSVEPVTAPTPPKPDPAVTALTREVRRLADRLERLEDSVEFLREDAEQPQPLSWPVPVESESRLEVPPLDVSRSSSPAYDVLLGPARRDTA